MHFRVATATEGNLEGFSATLVDDGLKIFERHVRFAQV